MKRFALVISLTVLCATVAMAETFESVEIDATGAEPSSIVLSVTNEVYTLTLTEAGLLAVLGIDSLGDIQVDGDLNVDGEISQWTGTATLNYINGGSAHFSGDHEAEQYTGYVVTEGIEGYGYNAIPIRDGLGNLAIYIECAGNVGIKCATPHYDLEVAGSIGASHVEGGRLEAPYVRALDNGGITFEDQNGGDLGIWTNAGNLGIGTTNPEVELDVVGDAAVSDGLTVGGDAEIEGGLNINYISEIGGVTPYTGSAYGWQRFYIESGLIKRVE